MPTPTVRDQYPDFFFTLNSICQWMREMGREYRIDGAALAKDLPPSLPHRVYVMPDGLGRMARESLARLENLAVTLQRAHQLPARPRALSVPKLYDNVCQAAFMENSSQSSRQYGKAALLAQLKLQARRGRDARLQDLIARIERHPGKSWTMRSSSASVSYHARIQTHAGHEARTYVHRNGLVLVGDDVRIRLPGDWARKPRSDRLGAPEFTYGRWQFHCTDQREKAPADPLSIFMPHPVPLQFGTDPDQEDNLPDAWL
jgi:hypothetical protein